MAKGKRKRRDGKMQRRKRRAKGLMGGPTGGTLHSARLLGPEEQSITKEVEYIIGRAGQPKCHVVAFHTLVLFSTTTGDAWVLDSEDNFALCLMKNFERREVTVLDDGAQFSVQWEAVFAIDGEFFTVGDEDGRVTSIHGYPTGQIQRMLDVARSRGQTSQ